MSAPSRLQASSFSCEPAVTATMAPACLPSWIAVVPMPLPPPWISSVSPFARRAPRKTLEYTVHTVSGSAAASTRVVAFGAGSSWPAGTATFSA